MLGVLSIRNSEEFEELRQCMPSPLLHRSLIGIWGAHQCICCWSCKLRGSIDVGADFDRRLLAGAFCVAAISKNPGSDCLSIAIASDACCCTDASLGSTTLRREQQVVTTWQNVQPAFSATCCPILPINACLSFDSGPLPGLPGLPVPGA